MSTRVVRLWRTLLRSVREGSISGTEDVLKAKCHEQRGPSRVVLVLVRATTLSDH